MSVFDAELYAASCALQYAESSNRQPSNCQRHFAPRLLVPGLPPFTLPRHIVMRLFRMKLAASYLLGHPNWHCPEPGLCPWWKEKVGGPPSMLYSAVLPANILEGPFPGRWASGLPGMMPLQPKCLLSSSFTLLLPILRPPPPPRTVAPLPHPPLPPVVGSPGFGAFVSIPFLTLRVEEVQFVQEGGIPLVGKAR